MKKNQVIALVVMLFGGAFTSAKAQENVFKINIFSPIVKTINVAYERKLSATGSFQLGAFYTFYSASETKFTGFGVTPEYRFYLSESEAPAGVYIAPFIRYQNFELTEEVTNSKGTFSLFGGGLIIGKHWIFKEKISLDIFLGPQYSAGDVKVTSGSDTFNTDVFDGFGLRTGVTLGYAF